MAAFFTPARLLRIVLYLVAGMLVGTLLARASDALWWQVLPWVLLAMFWAFLISRHLRHARGRRRS